MKKLLAVCLILGLTLNLSGCAVGDLVDRFTNVHDADEDDNATPKQRVYMDELKGTLVDFTGNTITITANEETYLFNVSEATLECKSGMIAGDEISIIYEGKLSDTDTSSVKALKVVTNYHNQEPMKEQTVTGTVQNITSNTITLTDETGLTATYPITGSEVYFANGIQKDALACIHYYGELEPGTDSVPKTSNLQHVKVISVSDVDPLKPPVPEELTSEHTGGNQLHATIQGLSLNTLNILLADGSASFPLDISQIPCYFQGGISAGSAIVVNYSGNFNGTSSDGISVIHISAEPAKKNKSLVSVVSGIIMANTANTITIQTSDGAAVTCSIDDLTNVSANLTEIGTGVKVTFDPISNITSNIYTCLKLEEM